MDCAGHESPLRLSGNRRSSSTQASPSAIRASPSQSAVKRANQAAFVQLTDDLLDAVGGAAVDNPWPGQSEYNSPEPFGTMTCANAPMPIPNSALPLGSTANAVETPALVPGVDLRPTNAFALPLVGSHAMHLAHLLSPMVLGGMGRLASPHGSSVSGTLSHAPELSAVSHVHEVFSSSPHTSSQPLSTCFACRQLKLPKLLEHIATRAWHLVLYILLGRMVNVPPGSRICAWSAVVSLG